LLVAAARKLLQKTLKSMDHLDLRLVVIDKNPL
jgi:hypothetical protein